MGGAFPAKIFRAIPLGVLAFGLTLAALDFPFVVALRESAFDQYQKLSPRPYQPLPIRVIAIDEESLNAFGQWPWPRRRLADLTERLADLGVAAIGFDLLLAEPDRYSPAFLAQELEPLPELRAQLEAASAGGELPDNDQLLADAFLLAPSVVGLALSGEGEAPVVKAGFALAGDDPIAFLPHLSASINPLPELRETAVGLGALNVLRESGGILRRLPLLFSVDGIMVPSLALELLRVAQGAPSYVVRASGASGISSFGAQTGVNTIKAGQFQIPTDASGSLWLYDSGPVEVRQVSARDILLGSPEDSDLEGFIVIVGVTAAGLGDRHATPLAAGAPGVTLHAQVLEQVITGAFLTRPDWAPGAELAFIALLSLFILYFYWRRRSSPLFLIAAGTLGVAVAVGGSWILFDRYRLLIDPVMPTLVCVAVYLSASAIRFWQADRERRWVRQAFAHYVEPSVVDILASDPKRLKLGGERKELTLLFCDLRGFTALSERLPVEATTEVINRFLTAMGDAVLKNHGTIDKYMGDCVMAFWNAPLDDPFHARNACFAALDMRRAMEELRQDYPDLRMGIGINTGACSVGNMGSDKRFDYSALGDAVNLASRLQGATKTVGVDILISKATKEQAGDFPFQAVGELELRGHREKISAFTLPEGRTTSEATK